MLRPLALTLSFQLGHLGSGSNAFVKKAIYNGKLVAVKLFYKKGENREEDYLREVSTLKKVSHDNIIKLIKSGKWSEKNDLFNCMIIEFADTGSLYHGNGSSNLGSVSVSCVNAGFLFQCFMSAARYKKLNTRWDMASVGSSNALMPSTISILFGPSPFSTEI